MATITKSIGSAGRDYSTITAWHAALDGAAGGAGNDAVGECHNDSVFAETFTLNSSVPASILLRAAAGKSHSGTLGAGVKIDGGGASIVVTISPSVNTRIADLEIVNAITSGVSVGFNSLSVIVNRLLIHDFNQLSTVSGIFVSANGNIDATNNIIFGMTTTGGSGQTAHGIFGRQNNFRTERWLNNTVYGITNDNGSGIAGGIDCFDGSLHTLRNNIAVSVGGTTSGSKFCYPSSSATTKSNNISSDLSANGTGSIASVTASSLFVSIVPGSEDLHLKSGAVAIGAGANLGTTPTGVNFDIDGYDRTLDAAWDIGADQSVASGGRLINGGRINRGLINRGRAI